MTDYLYRIVSSPIDKEDWRLFISSDFPKGAQGLDTMDWQQVASRYNETDSKFKYKLQRYPLTQEWTDVDE